MKAQFCVFVFLEDKVLAKKEKRKKNTPNEMYRCLMNCNDLLSNSSLR